jgi:adenylate cyclase
MSQKQKSRTIDKIKFPISAKLITIISFIVIISLGSIIVLVSWLVRQDLQISAEENNFEVNRRSAMEAETLITNVRAHSRLLIQNITAMGTDSAFARNAAASFFTENPQIACVYFVGAAEKLLVNSRFFASRETDEALASSFFENHKASLARSVRGETLLVNAAPHFARPVLALFFPVNNNAASAAGAGAVLFSSESLNNNFGFGTNISYMINSDGDIIAHSDFSLVRNGVNIINNDFIRSIMDSSDRNRQQLADIDGIRQFSAFSKLNAAGAIVITGIEYGRVFEGINATTRRNLYLTIAVLSISIIFIWFFSKTISVPLRSLASAARRIEGGRFDDLDLHPKGKDEIGVLTSSFKKMGAALHIFGRFTNKEIAVKAMRGEIKPGGVPKHATVFFSDIRSFTELSEKMTKAFGDEASDRIVFWLNNYLTRMIECIEQTNGVVDKFIGDAVMAHWGTAYSAGSPRDDALNCIRAALLMRKALYNLNSQRKIKDDSNPVIRIGCGINTGIVTAGQIGSDLRMEYTVIGDPVNLASRIEALTKPLGADILISENTWDLVKDVLITEEMPSVTVKGKEKPLRIFAVVNYKASKRIPQTLSEVRKVLGIKNVDTSKVNVNEDEKKYRIDQG